MTDLDQQNRISGTPRRAGAQAVTTHAKNGYTLTTIQERALLCALETIEPAVLQSSGAINNNVNGWHYILPDLLADLRAREEQRKRDDAA